MEAPHDQHPAPPPQAPPGDRTGADGTGSTGSSVGAAESLRNETILTVPTAEAMRALGLRLAGLLRAGDLVLLTGELGAGKTTLTRGLGEGLGVRGAVTSPTFVIARVHPPLADGPPLVHVDAYRLGGGLEEMEDLDLDVSLPDSVVVVEWGEGKVEELTEQRLHVVLTRATGRAAPSGDDGPPVGEGDGDTGPEAAEDVRTVTLVGVGPRWAAADFGALG
ncbi:tRNA (adenosine(37)-N6)-threonylcarbamoyltransferase complex ATPase subunit type 1 TsaE [Streptomyces sp. NPDC006784]|uniref:tRNA (adenosine(37)-N6)-threonylcarbamoyltransferase complex ATPase subunit type 1 TsaE n=1 Tax=Streptomyces sp. NPDC006784 TaxID=3364764 RepID=UPI003697024A